MNELGDYLKKLRGKRSIREAAEGIGISHTYLSTLEKGYDPRTKKERKPTVEVLGKISRYYDVPFLKLLDMANKKALSDFSDDEINIIFQETTGDMHKEIQEVIFSELSMPELNYLSVMVRFLKMADEDDIKEFSLVVNSLIRSVEYKNDNNLNKDELNYLLKGELDRITKFFHNYFFNDSNKKEAE